MPKEPNTTCSGCGSPLYRHAVDQRRFKKSLCPECLEVERAKRSAANVRKRYLAYIERWLNGEESGMAGKTSISAHIKRYLLERSNGRCESCGWAEVNTFTGRVPLEVHHKDGDHTNNVEKNLLLVCPNCHSLTGTYRALNMGNGRPRGG